MFKLCAILGRCFELLYERLLSNLFLISLFLNNKKFSSATIQPFRLVQKRIPLKQ